MPRKTSRPRWVHLVRRAVVQSSLAGLLVWTVSSAQVQTDITPDSTMGTGVIQFGAVHNIVGGTRPESGQNLFHSFDRFSVGTGDTARFWPEPGVENIISRVTGHAASMIDGTLQAEANVFLLNPQGIMFGPHATLDINGSFHASTADVLRFADGAEFSSHMGGQLSLTVAAPSAFGFLHADPAGIAIEGSDLEVPEGQTLSVIGGDMTIESARIAFFHDPASLVAPGGQINLVSVASRGEVVVDPTGVPSHVGVESFDQFGEIEIAQGSRIDVSGANGGGQVLIRGRRLVIDNAWVRGGTIAAESGNQVGIDIEIADEIVLAHGGIIETRADEAGRHAADIRVTTGRLQMENSSFMTSQTSSPGDAGDVTVVADNVNVQGGSQISSVTFGPGHGGAVTVRAKELTLAGTTPDNRLLSGIFANAHGAADDAGDAGTILVEADHIRLSGGAQITSATFGPGRGGTVTVRARDITLEGTTPDNRLLSGIFANAQGAADDTGDAGTILVEADHIRLSGGAQITSATFGGGRGGTVTVWARDITLAGATPDRRFLSGIFTSAHGAANDAGDAGTILVETDRIRLSGGAQIVSATFGPGRGGTVTVRAQDISLEGRTPDDRRPSGIFAESNDVGDAGTVEVSATVITIADGATISVSTVDGAGGQVTVTASTLRLEDGGNIQAQTAGDGAAGDIRIDVGTLILTGGAQISSDSGIEFEGHLFAGEGRGGHITITATDTVLITGENSSLRSNALGNGQSGTITLQAPMIQLTEGATISAQSTGTGNAGNIRIMATDTLLLSGNSAVTTEATQAGGGNIEIEARTASIADSDITTTVRSGEGSGGNIAMGRTITDDGTVIQGMERLTLKGSRITANTDAGDGANIAIGARQVGLDSGSEIAANTHSGAGGNVTIAGTVAADGQVLTRAEAIVLRHSRITANAQAGKGGRIDMVAEVVLADPASDIDASSQTGIDGEVNIDAVRANLSDIMTPLSPRFDETAALLSDPCASRLQQGLVSSLVARGRASVPAAPDGLLPGRLYTSEIGSVALKSAVPHETLAYNPHVRLSHRPCP